MNIWKKQSSVSRQLLAWALGSIGVGTALLLGRSRPEDRGIGLQFVTWGAIDGLIAIFGQLSARRRQNALTDPEAPEVVARERRNLGRLLWINAGLDVGYVLGGLALMRRRPANRWWGHGLGIVIQGGFLLMFDLLHALTLSEPDNA